MKLHDEIMNIPCEPIAGTESEVLAFKLGHKQALHAAAELADKQLIGHAPFHDRPVGEPYMLPTMHAPSIINRHYPEDSESAALMELKLKDMVDQHRQNTADAYVNAMDDHVVIVMSGIDEEPASLSKAMKFLESKEVQMRREQKLREEISALRAAKLYSGDTGEEVLAVSVMGVRGADYEAGRAAEQAIVAKWLDERGKYCECVADEHVDDHQTCRKWEIRAHEAFTSASAIREGRHK